MTGIVPNVARAASDYLACSRSRDLYASEADYLRAEEELWDRLLEAVEIEMSPFLGGALFND